MTRRRTSAMNRHDVGDAHTAATDHDQANSSRPDVNDLLTSGAVRSCYYATQHDQRPDCEQLATVVYGPIALCADCDRRRSAVGKGTTPRHLPDPDPLTRIRPARRAVQAAEADLAATVTAARAAGHPWSAIAAALGISRQAAQQRFAPNQHRPPPDVNQPLTSQAGADDAEQPSPPPDVNDPLTSQAGADDVNPPSPDGDDQTPAPDDPPSPSPAPGDGPPSPTDHNPPSPPPDVNDPLTSQAAIGGNHNPPSPPADSDTPIPVDHHRNGADPAVAAQPPPDPALLAGIDLARHALDHAHAVLCAALVTARAAGHPWSAIAAALAPPPPSRPA